jgi:hypothetical protein
VTCISLAMAVLLTAMHVTAASAQSGTAVPGRLEFDGGVLWMGAQSLGSRDATLTTGTGSTLRLFGTTSDLGAVAGVEGLVGVKVTRAMEVHAAGSYATPQLSTRVSNDTENAAAATAIESVRQYTIGGGLIWYAPLRRSTSRLKPFVGGEVAYLRQLHEGSTLVATGQSYSVGGGAKLLLAVRTRKRAKALGFRFDGRVVVRTKGITFDGRRSIAPAAGASLFVRF